MKKLLVILTAVILVLTCAFAFVACSGDKVEGTYYVYVNGVKQDDGSMTLKDGKVSVETELNGQSIELSGTYTVEGDIVKVSLSVMGITTTQKMTIVSDGVLKDSAGNYYCKDGKTPPAEEETEGTYTEGTYYVYVNGVKQDDGYMELKDGKVTVNQEMMDQSVELTGTYTVEGHTVKISFSVFDISTTQNMTIVSDGVLKDSIGTYYCKDGYTPPADE